MNQPEHAYHTASICVTAATWSSFTMCVDIFISFGRCCCRRRQTSYVCKQTACEWQYDMGIVRERSVCVCAWIWWIWWICERRDQNLWCRLKCWCYFVRNISVSARFRTFLHFYISFFLLGSFFFVPAVTIVHNIWIPDRGVNFIRCYMRISDKSHGKFYYCSDYMT